MITRRKFLRAGALFLPATAMGQISVPNRRVFVNPACLGTNFTAADFEPWRYNSGCGWANNLPYLPTNNGGNNPDFQTRTLQFGTAPRIGGNGWTWARKLEIGNNWNQIRIGMLHQSDAVANIGGAGWYFRFGMINSPKNWGGAGDNFIGYQMGGTWTYSTNQYISNQASGINAHTNVNTVNTFSLLYSGAAGNLMTNSSGHRSLTYVELTKGTPNFTVGAYIVTNAGDATQDMNEKDLNTGLGLAGGAAMTISGRTINYSSAAMAFSEANGNLDTVILYSEINSITGATHSLCAVGVRKIS